MARNLASPRRRKHLVLEEEERGAQTEKYHHGLPVPRWNLKCMSLILAESNEASRLLVEVSCTSLLLVENGRAGLLLVEANRKCLLAEEDHMCLLLVEVKN